MTQSKDQLMYLTDAYKVNHINMYHQDVASIQSCFTARNGKYNNLGKKSPHGVVFFGAELMVTKLNGIVENFFDMDRGEFLEAIAKYKNFFSQFFGLPEDQIKVDHWVRLYNDYGKSKKLPVIIRTQKELSHQPYQVPLFTIENTDNNFAWLVNYLETFISSELWLPCTSATAARELKSIAVEYSDLTCDNDYHIPYSIHDFSERGMSNNEASITSSLAHLQYFNGTDCVQAARKQFELTGHVTGSSVPATEHSIMVIAGKEGEFEELERLIDLYPTGFLSLVSDTYDYWKLLSEYLPKLKDKIMNRDGRVVIRPDSGTPIDIICGLKPGIITWTLEDGLFCEIAIREVIMSLINEDIINVDDIINATDYSTIYFDVYGKFHSVQFYCTATQDFVEDEPVYEYVIDNITLVDFNQIDNEAKGSLNILFDIFGGTVNNRGYKVLNPKIGLIYGDGMNCKTVKDILRRMECNRFASSNVVFGIGSMQYQYVTRDTHSFAIKATWCQMKDGTARNLIKNPKTDPDKKSLTGYFVLPVKIY